MNQTISYRIREETAECIMSRTVTLHLPPGNPIQVGSEVDLIHYKPPNIPEASPLVTDLQAAILEAMEALNREVEKVAITSEKPTSDVAMKSLFKQMREAARE